MFDIQPSQLIIEESLVTWGWLGCAGLTWRRGCWAVTGDWADVVLAGAAGGCSNTATTTAARHGLNISNMAHTNTHRT